MSSYSARLCTPVRWRDPGRRWVAVRTRESVDINQKCGVVVGECRRMHTVIVTSVTLVSDVTVSRHVKFDSESMITLLARLRVAIGLIYNRLCLNILISIHENI